jgi:acetyl esterase/lipase
MKSLFISIGLVILMAFPMTVQAMAPSKVDVAYGESPAQRLDIYQPNGAGPFPVVMFIHAGGWQSGDKKWFMSGENMKRYLNAGIAVVSINYRFIGMASKDGLFPPVLGPFNDAKRAVQFLRYHAKEWNFDAARIALSGESAGACSSLWLGLSPEMANPASADPVDHMSTRVSAIGVTGAQTSLDPQQMREWVGPELAYGGQAFGLPEADFALFLKKRPEFERYFPTISPAALLSANEPPIYLLYGRAPDDPKKDHMFYVHSPSFGIGFQKLAKRNGVVCHLAWKGHPSEDFKGDVVDFIIQNLNLPKNGSSSPR